MRSFAFAPIAGFVVVSLACGGSRPSSPASPTAVSRAVAFVAFLDENRNSQLDGFETLRIPGVEVAFGGVAGKTSPTTGEVVLTVAPAAQSLTVLSSTLPPYYRGPDPALVTPSSAGPVAVPILLPLGPGATPGVYLAFGDSITNGQANVGDGQGYIGHLERMLAAHFGRARLIADGLDSSSSERGDDRISASLSGGRPAFTLIQYGTNDWSDPRCGEAPCFTIERLRSMMLKVKAAGGFPFVGTLLMTNVGNDFRASPQRNAWVIEQNDLIRRMAAEEQVVLVDIHAAFERSPYTYAELFADYIHPSAMGYKVIADTWFEAITSRR
jgi:lysophospholipase L1-like esterase